MTRLIGEPSDKRDISNHEYRTRQLERRPRPVSDTTIPVFRARRYISFQTIADSSEVDLTWNQWDNGDPDVFDTTLSGGLLRSVTLLVAGVYSFSCVIAIQSLSAGSLAIVMNDGYDNPTCMVHPAYTFGAGADYDYSNVKTYPPFMPFDTPAGVAEISFDLAQNSGISRNTLFGTMMEICFLGPLLDEATS